jgi:tetratricopeptide (TPR) repeat protein
MKALLVDTPVEDWSGLLPISLLWLAIGIAVTIVFSCIKYCAGAYIVRETANAADNKPAMPRWLWQLLVTAGVLFAVIIVGLAAGIYMTKPILDALVCYKQGQAEYKKKKYDQAIADFTMALQHYPNLVGAYEYRAWCYIATQENDKAVADSNEALRIQPNLATAHTSRGYAYYAQGNFDKAIVDLTQAIELGPKVASRWASRAYAHGHKAEFDKSIADFTEAIRLEPEHWQYYADRGNSYFYKGDFINAFADFDRAKRMERESEGAEDENE